MKEKKIRERERWRGTAQEEVVGLTVVAESVKLIWECTWRGGEVEENSR